MPSHSKLTWNIEIVNFDHKKCFIFSGHPSHLTGYNWYIFALIFQTLYGSWRYEAIRQGFQILASQQSPNRSRPTSQFRSLLTPCARRISRGQIAFRAWLRIQFSRWWDVFRGSLAIRSLRDPSIFVAVARSIYGRSFGDASHVRGLSHRKKQRDDTNLNFYDWHIACVYSISCVLLRRLANRGRIQADPL